jgi:antitoxin YefM
MLAANYSEFRVDLKKYLDSVEHNNETLIIKRSKGKGAVLISLDEYNSIMETMHLLSSKANADRLYESIEQMKSGKTVSNDLAGFWSRRINLEHRLVYKFENNSVYIYSCKYHYDK